MSKDPADTIREKNSALVRRIYAGALKPSDYNDIFHAWDDLFQALVDEDVRKQSEDFEWTEEYIDHFERAGKLFDKLATNQERALSERIHEMPFAVVLSRLDGRLLAWNKHVNFADDTPETLNDILFDPDSEQALKPLIKGGKLAQRDALRVVIRLSASGSSDHDVYLAEVVEEISQDTSRATHLLLLRAITASWGQSVERALAAAFQLTPAELDLLESLYRGLTIKEISAWKARSQATLRTQLSSILQKTRTKSQADLLRMAAGLVQVLQQQDQEPLSGVYLPNLSNSARQRTNLVDLADGTQIEVVESGDLSGRPFYFIQTSSSPILTPRIVECLAAQGVRLVSPHRSGLGRTTRKPISFGPGNWAAYHSEVIERLDLPPDAVGGHRCGGVYAMELAKHLGQSCRSLLLVDTGAPLKSASMINQMPASPKRLFLAARYFPPAIRTPYKLVTADFYSGGDAEDRLVSYFYDGSPSDQRILHQGENWQVSRDNIDYCLRNPLQTAQDVSMWSRDTSALLASVQKHSHVHYFHGADNTVMRAANIQALPENMCQMSYTLAPGRGQLLIYVEPEMFAQEIRNARDRFT